MKMKNIYGVISLGIAGGCIAGALVAGREIAANRYLSYALYNLCADVLRRSLNTGAGTGLALSVILIMLCLLYYRCAPALRRGRSPAPASHKSGSPFFSFRWTTALVMPCIIILVAANLLPGMLTVGADRPPVILISIDDLRADHVGCYGYERNTTPHIDLFAKEGILFKNCYVPEPWTLTSHMSMLTSLYPITHGVTMTHALDPAIVTLAEALSNQGYDTMGFVSGCAWMNEYYGFKQGFQRYLAMTLDDDAAHQNALVKKHLEQQTGNPLFIFIHYLDVHSDTARLPYDSPPPYSNRFSGWYRGDFTGGEGDMVASKYLGYLNKAQIRLSTDDLDYIISLYDNGIAYMDACLGDVFALLQEMGLYEDALIIVTADHGEEFQEHGFMSHGFNPYYYEESVRVPLIIKLPQGGYGDVRRGTAVGGLVESIDIMPTVMDVLGIEGPPMQGTSVRGVMSGSEEGKEAVCGFGEGGRLFIRSGPWKLLSDRGLQAGRCKLFDLEHDPAEQVDLIGENPEIAERLKRRLGEIMEASQRLRRELLPQQRARDDRGDAGEVPLTPEDREKLKALGYLQ